MPKSPRKSLKSPRRKRTAALKELLTTPSVLDAVGGGLEQFKQAIAKDPEVKAPGAKHSYADVIKLLRKVADTVSRGDSLDALEKGGGVTSVRVLDPVKYDAVADACYAKLGPVKVPASAFDPYEGKPYITTDYNERKEIPIMTGVIDYFPLALLEVAKVSAAGNAQHNPGEALHWARGKSMDQVNTTIRHLMERGTRDVDGSYHYAKAIWRLLAGFQIQLELERGLPPSRGCTAQNRVGLE